METVYTAPTAVPVTVSAIQILSVVLTVAYVPLVLVWLVEWLARAGR